MTKYIDRYYLNGEVYGIKFASPEPILDLPELTEWNMTPIATASFGNWGNGPTFSSDGTKIFNGGVGDGLLHYGDLSTPYDISSISNTNSINMGIGAWEGLGTIQFTPDGLYSFIGGNFGSSTNLKKYQNSSAYDVTNIVEVQHQDQVGNAYMCSRGFCFSTDGTKLFCQGSANGYIACYSLSTAWDISNITFVNEADFTGAESPSWCFNEGGTSMYVACYGDYTLYRFSLSTPRDVTTSTQTSSLYIGSIFGVNCIHDGTTRKLYISSPTYNLKQYALQS